jgi:serine/threonine protein kinase
MSLASATLATFRAGGMPCSCMKKLIVPDHEVLTFIGSGSYGQVWLARNVLGTYRAVKVVWRETLPDTRHYDREFEGIRHFEPISRSHPNLVAILQVGRSQDDTDYFYYVMELADPIETHLESTKLDTPGWEPVSNPEPQPPENYEPRTLSSELRARGRLPLKECCDLGLALTGGLGRLHQHRLVHRDIKPSNIIFISGVPKIADIGLVTLFSERPGFAGTLGYLPARGYGTPGGDLYGLGKVLYRACTGKEVQAFPELPGDLADDGNLLCLRRFNDVLVKACDENPDARFQSAQEMFAELHRVFDSSIERPGLIRKWWRFLWPTDAPSAPLEQPRLEAVGGAVPLASPFYLERPADDEFHLAIKRQDSIVSVKGARQMGKTSLLARGLERARLGGNQVILTDFQDCDEASLSSVKDFYLALGASLEDELELNTSLAADWNDHHSPNRNFDRFLRRTLQEEISGHLFWGMDELDRLFSTSFQDEIFSKFRSFHEKRVLEPNGPWKKLTLAIAFATEAHLLIRDLNRSPFNVGTRIVLEDFSQEQVARLNELHGGPLRDQLEVARFTKYFGGHPYLTRRGLYEMVTRSWRFDRLMAQAENLFEDHLQRVLRSLREDSEMVQSVLPVLRGQPCSHPESFFRLRSAGIISGNYPADCQFRCLLYQNFLTSQLLP